MVYRPVKLLSCIIFLFAIAYGTNPGSVAIRDIRNDTTFAKVTQDSALFVAVNGMSFNGDSSLKVVLPGRVSDENTSLIPLDAGDSFVGEFVNILNYAAITILACTDQNSALNGLEIQWSVDSSMVCEKDNFTILADKGKLFTFFPGAKYLRVKYKNGAITQTSFQLQTILKRTNIQSSSHRVSDSIVGDDDAILVKTVVTGLDPNNIYHNVRITKDGNLTISDNSSGLAIAKGDVTGASYVHKFGNAPDFAQTDGTITLWDGADNANINQMVYQYSTTADISQISSSSVLDSQQIQIQGLGSDSAILIDTVTLQGQVKVAIGTSFLRIVRLVNINTSDNVGYIYVYVDGAITSGVPNTPSNVRAVIQPGYNQTLMAVYTVPKAKTGYIRDWFASIAGANKTSNYVIQLRVRPPGGVFQLKHISSISDNGTSSYQHNYREPEMVNAFSDIEIRCSVLATGVTAASISGGFDIVLIDN